MTALVVAAMASELRAFTRRARGLDVATGLLGIGTARARIATERLLAEHRPERVLVVGVAGGIGPTTSIGSLVVPGAVLDGDSGATFTPTPVAGLDATGTLRTSDELVVDPAHVAALVEQGVVALDMETAAVAAVCDGAAVPWSVLRGISDHADAELIAPDILGLMDADGRPRPGAVAAYVARRPSRIAHLRRLAQGLRAATTASAEAAVRALATGAPPGR